MRVIAWLTAGAAIVVVVILALADGVVEVVAFELIVGALIVAAFLALGPVRPARIIERAPIQASLTATDHPPQLQRLEWIVEFATTASADAELRLIPELRELAAARLQERHRVDIARDPEAAAELIGPQAWAYLDPSRPPQFGRSALEPEQVETIVASIEAL